MIDNPIMMQVVIFPEGFAGDPTLGYKKLDKLPI